MAKFSLEIPKELLSDIETLRASTELVFGEMCKTGAEQVHKNILANMPPAIATSDMKNCLKITDKYITPSDGGVNVKVGFFGYFENEKGETVPAPLVANVWEYGRSSSDFPKYPFIRKSFRAGELKKVMLEKQKELTGGLLE